MHPNKRRTIGLLLLGLAPLSVLIATASVKYKQLTAPPPEADYALGGEKAELGEFILGQVDAVMDAAEETDKPVVAGIRREVEQAIYDAAHPDPKKVQFYEPTGLVLVTFSNAVRTRGPALHNAQLHEDLVSSVMQLWEQWVEVFPEGGILQKDLAVATEDLMRRTPPSAFAYATRAAYLGMSGDEKAALELAQQCIDKHGGENECSRIVEDIQAARAVDLGKDAAPSH